MKNLKILTVLLILMSFNLFSQVGPQIPECSKCEEHPKPSIPTNTVWWNPDQAGVGLTIDVQGLKLLGIFHGYNQDGQATWYTFVGDLIPSNDKGVMWDFSASLTSFKNGKCFGCEYQRPEIDDTNSSISIRFNHKNHASFSINDGEYQNIIPFVYNRETHADFPTQTSLELPDLSGQWVFVIKNPPNTEFNPVQSIVLNLTNKFTRDFDDGTREISYSGIYSDVFYPALSCKTYIARGVILGPVCVLFGSFDENNDTDGYVLNLGGIGSKLLFGTRGDDTIEGFKLND